MTQSINMTTGNAATQPKSKTVATRVSADQKRDLEMVATYHRIDVSKLLRHIGVNDALEHARKLRAGEPVQLLQAGA